METGTMTEGKKKDDDSQIQFSNKILNHAEDGNELILHKMP